MIQEIIYMGKKSLKWSLKNKNVKEAYLVAFCDARHEELIAALNGRYGRLMPKS
jgi:hypothetical protein